jgi:hypothetical protein
MGAIGLGLAESGFCEWMLDPRERVSKVRLRRTGQRSPCAYINLQESPGISRHPDPANRTALALPERISHLEDRQRPIELGHTQAALNT